METRYILLALVLATMLAVSGSLVGTGVWLVRKQYGPAYHVGGVAAIILGALCALGAFLVLIGFLAFTGPPLDSG